MASISNLKSRAFVAGIAPKQPDLSEDDAAKAAGIPRSGGSPAISGHEGEHPVHDTVIKAYRHMHFFRRECFLQVCTPRVAARGRGAIVSVIGNGGKMPSAVHLPGGATNAALMVATAGLVHACAPRGVRMVFLNPGPVQTASGPFRRSRGNRGHRRFRGIGAGALPDGCEPVGGWRFPAHGRLRPV